MSNLFAYKKFSLLYAFYTLFSKAAVERGIFILYLTEKNLKGTEISILQTVLFLTTFIAEIPSGILADKYSRKANILVGLFLLIIYAVGMIVFQEFIPFLILFVLQGISFALFSGADEALLYDSLKAMKKQNKFIKLKSIIGAISCASLGTAMALGGLLQSISWDYVYLLYAAFILIASLCMWLITEPKLHEYNCKTDIESFASISKLLTTFFFKGKGRRLLLVIVAITLFESALTPYYVYGQLLFSEKGIAISSIGIIYAMAEYFSSIMMLFAQKVSKIFRLKVIIKVTMTISTLLLLSNAFASKSTVILVFFISMIVPDIMDILVRNFLHQEIPSSIRASVISVISALQSLLICIMYITYGVLLNTFSVANVIALTTILPLISVILVTIYFSISAKKHIK